MSSSVLDTYLGKHVVVQTIKPIVACYCTGYDKEKECATVGPIVRVMEVPAMNEKGEQQKDAQGKLMFTKQQTPLEATVFMGELGPADERGFILESPVVTQEGMTCMIYITHENCGSITLSLSELPEPEEPSRIIAPN